MAVPHDSLSNYVLRLTASQCLSASQKIDLISSPGLLKNIGVSAPSAEGQLIKKIVEDSWF